MKRIYPLRFSRTYWSIPLVSEHICNPNICSQIPEYDENTNEFRIVANPEYKDGECAMSHWLYPTVVSISSYSYKNPSGNMGRLYRPDRVVIPDKEFTIKIDFPLSNPTEIQIRGDGNYTIRDVLFFIKTAYEKIYKEEEETSTEREFTFQRDCECKNQNISQHWSSINPPHPYENECCSICYEEFENKSIVQLNCNHTFDLGCITNWTNTDNNTCPLCRQPIINCQTCSGSGFVTYTQRYKVVPMNLRGVDMFRNDTDGKYGIYQYDMENLLLDKIFYNSKLRLLSLQIDAA